MSIVDKIGMTLDGLVGSSVSRWRPYGISGRAKKITFRLISIAGVRLKAGRALHQGRSSFRRLAAAIGSAQNKLAVIRWSQSVVVAVILAAQAIAPFVAPAAAIDLRSALPAKCGSDGDEIVVCESPTANEQFRLRPLPEKYGQRPLLAETSIIGNMTGGVEAQQQKFGNGQVSKQMMVKITMPF